MHEQFFLGYGAHGGVDLDAEVLAELDSGLTNAASGRVNQDGLALAHSGQVDEGDPCC